MKLAEALVLRADYQKKNSLGVFDNVLFLNDLRIDARAGASPPPSQKHAYTIRKKCFLPHFHSGAGGRASPTPPQKNTSFALGMRRVRSRGVACNVSEAIA